MVSSPLFRVLNPGSFWGVPVPLVQVSILISLEPRGPVLQTWAQCASSETSRTSCLPHPHRPLSSGIAKSSLVFLHDNCLLPQAPARNMKKEASVKHSYLKSECAMASGKAVPRGHLQPGPVAFCSVACGRARQCRRRDLQPFSLPSNGRGVLTEADSCHRPPDAHCMAGDPRVREPLPLPDVISSGAKVRVSFPVGFPTHTADRINPRKRLLCEVWVPEMRVTYPGSPLGVSTSVV